MTTTKTLNFCRARPNELVEDTKFTTVSNLVYKTKSVVATFVALNIIGLDAIIPILPFSTINQILILL